MTQAGEAWTVDTAKAEQKRIHQDADHSRDALHKAAKSTKEASEKTATATYHLTRASSVIQHWHFIVEANAIGVQAKKEETTLADAIRGRVDSSYDTESDKFDDNKESAKDLTANDQQAAIELAESGRDMLIAEAERWIFILQTKHIDYFSEFGDIPSEATAFSRAASWLINDGLDHASNFFNGWGDALTAGGVGWLHKQLGTGVFVDKG